MAGQSLVKKIATYDPDVVLQLVGEQWIPVRSV